MTPDLEALARRAVACPRWRWMPGMLRLRDAPGKADHGKREGRVEARDDWSYAEWPCLPDLTDPATLGCLLALVREAWSEPILSVAWAGGRWYVVQRILCSVDALRWIDTATEAEALVAALEAAP
jgi:hypothetical protein